MANPALERLLGYGPGELVGVHSDDITLADDMAGQLELRHRLIAGEIDDYEFEKRFVRKDGAIVWVLLDATAIRDQDGRLHTVIVQVQDISARKAAEEALRQSEALFRATFEGAGVGMTLTGPDGRFVDANPAFCRFIGFSRDELLTMTSLDLTHPDNRPTSQELIGRVIDRESDAFTTEKCYLRADGSIAWGNLTVTSTRARDDQFMMIAQIEDITARKEAESALRASEARFRALVQNDPDIVVLIDSELNVAYVSPAAEGVFGTSPAEPLAPFAHYAERIHPEDRERALARLGAAGTHHGAVFTREVRIWHADSTWHWFQVTVVNLRNEPGIDGYLVTLQDTTGRKEAELAMATALKTQEEAIIELERLNHTKSRFLSTISHEFRTPLTAIIGYSEFMMGNDFDAALIAEDAEVIHREASRLNRMVDDVLLVDRVDAGRVSLQTNAIDLNAITRDVAETFRPLIERHPLQIDLDPGLRPVSGDRDRLSQAVTNLVSNAVKYSPDGGTIAITTRNEGDEVVMSIGDEGIGIAAENLSRVFERFERVETGIAGRISGTGLGLAIVVEILNLHGGRIWVESEPGEGSVFTLALPAQASAPPPDPARARNDARRGAAS